MTDDKASLDAVVIERRFDREDGVVSDTAQLPWFWSDLGVVSGLGPGLTC